MKRCPTCQSIYTDVSLSYCLQDGSKLVVVSDSASSADATWQISGGGSRAGEEPPPTEILRPEDMPTARVEATAPTREQPRARPTAVAVEQPHATAVPSTAPRSSAPVVALSVIVGILLLTLGGLIVWIAMRDKGRTETGVATANSNQGETKQENATRTKSSTNSSANTTTQPSPADTSAAQKEVQGVLNAWADTIRQRNLDEHMKYYADVLDVYYNATNVSSARVRTERSAAFSKYTSMEMQLSNINISVEPSGTRATATFDKTFDFRSDEKDFKGSGLNQFWFSKASGRWRITGEKDLKTYYINK